MREWTLGPGAPLALSLAADFRLCTPDYVNDHIWEIEIGGGDPPALSVHTTYGLRARSMRFFPRFTLNGQTKSDPASFLHQPCLHRFFPNFMALNFSPFSDLEVMAEYWVPDSHTLAGRLTLSNQSDEPISLLLELCGQLVPLNGQSLVPLVKQSVNVLVGRCADLAPVVFLTGGPLPSPGPYPSLALNLVLAPGDSRTLTWVQAALATLEDSLELARKTAARPWEVERMRIELVNAAQTFEIYTGDPDWDATFALSQKTAFSLFFGPNQHLPNPSFVLCRQVDQGYSFRGDGSDYPFLWSGQSPLESYYIANLLPGVPELAAGLVRNFLAIQSENGAIDWKPGLAGQRGRWLAGPLLASLAWQTFQHTGDLEFLREVQPKLENFTRCWFDNFHDRDGDGFPEWDHPLQSGLEDNPLFTVWAPDGQGADISVTESPALAALLYQEVYSLAKIAETLNQPQAIQSLPVESGRLRKLAEECWDPNAVIYHIRDRDTHRSPVGKRIGRMHGAGRLILGKLFRQPVRLLVRIELASDAIHRVEISLRGKNGDTPQVEKFERIDFQWGPGLAVATTRMVYTDVIEIGIAGLEKHDQVSVFVMDFSAEDVTLLLPLWAGIPDLDRAQDIVYQTVNAANRFEKPFGIPAISSSMVARTATNCDVVHMPWNLLIGKGLLGYGLRREAARLTGRLMSAIIQNLKQQHAFASSYHAVTGAGLGERNSVQGLAPLGLFLDVLGVQIMTSWRVVLSEKNPFPWPVTVKYRGLVVTRQADQTMVVFPDGRTVTLADPTNAVVSAE
jgi:hypothetical protein